MLALQFKQELICVAMRTHSVYHVIMYAKQVQFSGKMQQLYGH